MRRTTLCLPDDLKIEIEAVSKMERRSEAEVMRDALRQYVDQRRQDRWPRSIGMAADGSFDAADDEHYLKDHWKPDW